MPGKYSWRFISNPLAAAEEEQFGEPLIQLLAKACRSRDFTPSSFFWGTGRKGFENLRLQALLLLSFGKQEEFEQLMTACDRQLAPFF